MSFESPRHLVFRGLIWNFLYQAFETFAGFGSMLVLVRIIPASEYGRVAAVVGFLAVLNSFTCAVFFAHSLQLPDHEEPDWSAHWSAGLHVQGVLFLVCEAAAGISWFAPSYRAIAPLLHIAGFGLLSDLPCQIRIAMLRRQFDFRRLRILYAIGTAGSIITSLTLGFVGAGALGIVLGSNVLITIPFGVDLLLIRRWAPSGQWWKLPKLNSYASPAVFGAQQGFSSFIQNLRVVLESTVLAGIVGFTAVGLWVRAQSMYGASFGRVSSVLLETVYPLLPRYAPNEALYRKYATLLLQVIVWAGLPASIFLSLRGPLVSRLLYGAKWVAADSFIAPGVLLAFGVAIVLASANILVADNRLRESVTVHIISASVAVPFLLIAALGGMAPAVIVAVAFQLGAASFAFARAARLCAHNCISIVLIPPAVGCAIAGLCLSGVETWTLTLPIPTRLAIDLTLFFSVFGFSLRVGFSSHLASLVSCMPAAARIANILRMPCPSGIQEPEAIPINARLMERVRGET